VGGGHGAGRAEDFLHRRTRPNDTPVALSLHLLRRLPHPPHNTALQHQAELLDIRLVHWALVRQGGMEGTGLTPTLREFLRFVRLENIKGRAARGEGIMAGTNLVQRVANTMRSLDMLCWHAQGAVIPPVTETEAVRAVIAWWGGCFEEVS
jgi:hypothetical protein